MGKKDEVKPQPVVLGRPGRFLGKLVMSRKQRLYWNCGCSQCRKVLHVQFSVEVERMLCICADNEQVPAENYPFCTIDPNVARVPVPDERFDYLVESFKPKSVVDAVLQITDIAGLVKGASEGAGLGNAFLSHIRAVDAIFHVLRCFDNKNVTHVEGNVDPCRDMDIIREELLKKDIETVCRLLLTSK